MDMPIMFLLQPQHTPACSSRQPQPTPSGLRQCMFERNSIRPAHWPTGRPGPVRAGEPPDHPVLDAPTQNWHGAFRPEAKGLVSGSAH